MLFEEEAVTKAIVFVFDFEADHEAFAAVFFKGGVEDAVWMEGVVEPLAHFGGIFHQVFVLDDVKDGEGGGASEVVAPEGGAEHAECSLAFWRNEDAADREAVGHTLRCGYDVWDYAAVLVGEEFAASAVAALDFVGNEKGAV